MKGSIDSNALPSGSEYAKESERESEVLELIRRDPLISQQALGERLGISRSGVAGHIMKLTQKGLIRGKGYLLNDRPYVVVIGGANMDIQGLSGQPLVTGDSNPGRVRQSAGGVGRNVAENLARLEVDVRLISAFGRDHNSEQLLRQTELAGVDCSASFHFNGNCCSYLSVLDTRGELVSAVSDMAVMESLSVDCLSQRSALIKHAAALVIDANLPSLSLEYLLREYRHIPVFVDPVSATKAGRVRRMLSSIHTLKPNRLEAEQLTGMRIRSPEDMTRVANFFHRAGVVEVYLSLGSEGVFASNGSDSLLVPAARCRPKSVAGAGDAFMAGLVYSFVSQKPWPQGPQFAQACARIALDTELNTPPTLSVALIEQNFLAD